MTIGNPQLNHAAASNKYQTQALLTKTGEAMQLHLF
jgi:hypothetical protein